MDQLQGITYPYPYVNPYDNSFSQRVRQMAGAWIRQMHTEYKK